MCATACRVQSFPQIAGVIIDIQDTGPATKRLFCKVFHDVQLIYCSLYWDLRMRVIFVGHKLWNPDKEYECDFGMQRP